MSDKIKQVKETAIKASLNLIPYVGGALNEVFFEHRSRIKQKRIENFIESLVQYLNDINTERIDIENIKSEQFSDIFELILKKVSENRSSEKLDLFKKIFKNQLYDNSKLDFTEIYLELITKLSSKQITILTKYYQKTTLVVNLKNKLTIAKNEHNKQLEKIETEKRKAEQGEINELAISMKEEGKHLLKITQLKEELESIQDFRNHNYYELGEGDYMFFVQDLTSKSLMFDEGIGKFGHKPYHIMRLTSFGEKFIEFITK